MANPYFKLFTAPGSKAFSSAGLIARLPVSMTGIGIITMLSQILGSYWLAGAVAATFMVRKLNRPLLGFLTMNCGRKEPHMVLAVAE